MKRSTLILAAAAGLFLASPRSADAAVPFLPALRPLPVHARAHPHFPDAASLALRGAPATRSASDRAFIAAMGTILAAGACFGRRWSRSER